MRTALTAALLILGAHATGFAAEVPGYPASDCHGDDGVLKKCYNEPFSRPECLCRSACSDDYCPKPYQARCWGPYPSYYHCGPGECCCYPKRHLVGGAPPPPGSTGWLGIIFGKKP